MNRYECEKVNVYKNDYFEATQINGEDIDVFLNSYNLSKSLLGIVVLIIGIFFGGINTLIGLSNLVDNFSVNSVIGVLFYVAILVVCILVFKRTRKVNDKTADELLINGVYSVSVKFANVEKETHKDSDGHVSHSYYGYLVKEDGTTYDYKFKLSEFNYMFETGKLFFFRNKKDIDVFFIDDTLEINDFRNKTREKINE